jgi:hypothetical protein
MEGLSATSLFYFCDCFPPSSQVVILRLAVATVEAGGAGELQVGAVNRCLFVAVVPAHPPPQPPPSPHHHHHHLPPTFPPLSAAPLLWVTRAVAMGYRTKAGWLATCHPVSATGQAARAEGGGSARVRDAARGARSSRRAPQPTGCRARSGKRSAVGGGHSHNQGQR